MSWFRPGRKTPDESDEARHSSDRSLRWSALRNTPSRLEDSSPEEVEARLRRLSHGTYRA